METLIMIALMFAILYFMMIRPENKRKKKAQEMRDGLKRAMLSPPSAASSARL